MDSSNNRASSAEQFFDGIIRLVAVGGTALMFGEGINRLLTDVLTRGWRMSISLLAAYLVTLTILHGGEKWPRMRDRFFALRYPIAMLLACYIGYQWHIRDYGQSREGRLNEAARWACTKSVACQKEVENYLFDKDFD